LSVASCQQKHKHCDVLCTIHSGISSANIWTWVAIDSLQHEAHDEMYGICAFYDH